MLALQCVRTLKISDFFVDGTASFTQHLTLSCISVVLRFSHLLIKKELLNISIQLCQSVTFCLGQ